MIDAKENNVRDFRRHGFFIIYNHVLSLYLKEVGVTAWSVYCAFAYYAREHKTLVSVAQIARDCGVTSRTVQRATRKLREFHLISVTKRQGISMVELLDVENSKRITAPGTAKKSPQQSKIEKQIADLTAKGKILMKKNKGSISPEVREISAEIERLKRKLITERKSARAT